MVISRFFRIVISAGLFVGYIYHANADINVNTLADIVADDGQCSLHEAILTANSNNDSGNLPNECQGENFNGVEDNIRLEAGIYTLTQSLPAITEGVNIYGASATTTIINGNNDFVRIFFIDLTVALVEEQVRLFDLTVANARAQAALTNINSPTVILKRTVWRLNLARAIISVAGALLIEDSTFTNNTNGGDGGAIRIAGGATANVLSSTFSFNHSDQSGGAISVSDDESFLYLIACTFSGNHADRNGGAIVNLNMGKVWVFHSTLTLNRTDEDASSPGDGNGAAIYVDSTSEFQIGNSSVAGNIDNSGDGALFKKGDIFIENNTVLVTHGYNFIGNNNGATGTFPPTANVQTRNLKNDIVGIGLAPFDAELGALKNNGGPTLTHLPILTQQIISPLIDSGGCLDPNTTEQRNINAPLRIFDVPSVANIGPTGCDVGSVELSAADIDDGLCFPIRTTSGGAAVICL
jgi:CSLREA domain-containing protein